MLAATARLGKAGVWQALDELLLAELNAADRIDWSRAAVDRDLLLRSGGCL